MNMRLNRLTAIITLLIGAGVFILSGCEREPFQTGNNENKGAYVFVGKDIQNPYMQRVYEGFENACRELDAEAVYKAPDGPTAQKQIDIINELAEQEVAGIAVAANDADELNEALSGAMQKGIKVISLDSAVNSASRQTHIQQADPEKTGRYLVRAAYDIAGGNGGIGILSSTEYATNQNQWISYMYKEIEENPDKYASTPILEIGYGDDDLTKSISETEALLKNPQVSVIVSPTSVGMQAAGRVLTERESPVKLTGLGMPSQMAEYIESGVCPCMYLWNPADIGYMAGYTLDALAKGTITGASGETFKVGTLGERTITPDTEQGTEVMLGDLMKFDASNIAQWKDAY